MYATYRNPKSQRVNVLDIFDRQIQRREIVQPKGDVKQLKEINEQDLLSSRSRYISPMAQKEFKIKEKKDIIIVSTDRLSAAEPNEKKQIEIKNNSITKRKKSISSKVSLQDAPKINENAYKIQTNEQSLIKLPPNYSTNDIDLKMLVDLMNEPFDKKIYTEIVVDNICQIYKKTIPGCENVLMKSICSIPHPRELVYEAITNFDTRKKWDDSFNELKKVATNEENGADILYISLKSPSIVISERDFVQQRKIWHNFPNENSCLLHFKSVEHPLCPVVPKYIRAETIISGYYIQDDQFKPGYSILGIISQSDIKGKIPIWIVNKVTPNASKGWVMNLIKGCKMILSNRKK